MGINPDFIFTEVAKQTYEISIHADEERLSEGLTIAQVEHVLSNGEIIEAYPNDPRGKSCLVVGFVSPRIPVHVVCGKNRSGRLILITVYIPAMPKWLDPYTRNPLKRGSTR